MILSKNENKSAQKSDSVKTANLTPEKLPNMNWDKPLELASYNYFDLDIYQDKEPSSSKLIPKFINEFIDPSTLEILAPYMRPEKYLKKDVENIHNGR